MPYHSRESGAQCGPQNFTTQDSTMDEALAVREQVIWKVLCCPFRPKKPPQSDAPKLGSDVVDSVTLMTSQLVGTLNRLKT